MKKLILTAAAAASLAMLSNAAQAQCTIFSERYYKGAEGIIQPNDIVIFDKSIDRDAINTKLRVYFDSQWLNNVGSSMTTNSCRIGRISDASDLAGFSVTRGNTPTYATKEVVAVACACQ
jgi:hypothetical protein